MRPSPTPTDPPPPAVAAPPPDAELLRLLKSLDERLQEMQGLERAVGEKLEALSARMEGMQRHMLLQIHEAREHATRWKDKYAASKHEAEVWRDTLQAQNLQLMEQIAWLKGQKGVALGAGSVPPPQPARPAAVALGASRQAHAVPTLSPSRYPGHPRAVYGWDEESTE